MKKYLLFFSFFVCFFPTLIFSKNRTVAEASQLAGQFLNQSVSELKKVPSAVNSTLTLTYTSASTDAVKSGKVFYYVFNKGNDNGYVIISGDDRAKTILGYTDDGHFDISVLPANVKYWLGFYESELKSLPDSDILTINYSDSSVLKTKRMSANQYLTTIYPLLGDIKWNQDSPYNLICPVINSSTGERAVTGCVATGMAQVMKYYNWPVQGAGSNSYTSTTLKLSSSVDFSKTHYDWNNMTNTYSSSSSAIQDTAVATLMYHCGVAVNMDYGQSSSASTQKMALALINNFGYDSNLQLYSRDYYTRSEWANFLNMELNASHPVLFSGQASDGGHLFVCDGYDSNGLYHFNWGWGGVSNGYYEISALDPNNQGIGGTPGGFNSYQTIVVGLQKPSTTSTPIYLLYASKPPTCVTTSISRTGSFIVTGNQIYNMGVNTFNGSVGLALYNDNGLVQVIKSITINGLGSYYGWSALNMTSTTIPAGIANGSYKLYFVYKASTESNWQILRGKVGTANYFNVGVSTSAVTINAATNVFPVLTLDSLSVTGNLYQNKTGRISATITNTGAEYNSTIGILVKSTTDNTISQFISTEVIDIASGETRSINFTGTVTVAPGQYSVSTQYDGTNDYSTSTTLLQLGSALTLNVLATPTLDPNLTLTNSISFPNPLMVDKSNAVLSATIKNTSGFFDNKIIAFIFPAAGGSSLMYIGYQEAIFDTNEERTVTFSGPIDLTPAQYKVAVYYLNASSAWVRISPSNYSVSNFTLVDIQTATFFPTATGFEIYPNPVNDILILKTDLLLKRIVITDLLGKQLKSVNPTNSDLISVPVGDLKSGTYLIRVETDNEFKMAKFIKK